MPTVEKICCACGTDVAGAKRVKDQNGRYYCPPCFEGKRQQVAQAAAPVAIAASVSSHSPPPDDGLIGLADELAPPVQEEMFGCSDCKRVVPKRLIRNQEGEFICSPCFSKRRNPVASSTSTHARPSRKSFAEEEGQEEGALSFRYTLVGGLCISAAILVLTWGLFLALNMAMPPARHAMGVDAVSFLFSAVFAAVETVFVAFRAAALILSMVIAARILGGIDFGYLGNTLWKAVTAALVFSLVAFFIDRNETLMMLGFGLRCIIFLVTFAVLFHLDYFEAMLLSVINFFIFWGLAIVMAIVVIALARAMQHRSAADDEMMDEPPAPIVQPQAPPAAAPAPAPAPAP